MDTLLNLLEQLAQNIPVELFAFVGSFIEEVIAPIPSPFVMTLAGSIALAQELPFWYLFVISVIAATGKTIGAMMLYKVGDKVEDVVLSRAGKYIGVSHKEVEKFGSRFKGTARDYITLLAIRSAPVIPSAPISLMCGFVRIRFKMFVIATFLGTIIRDFIYLYFGYTSFGAAVAITEGFEGASSIVTLLLALAGAVVVGYIIYVRKFKKPTETQ